jgi:flagellar protein FliS
VDPGAAAAKLAPAPGPAAAELVLNFSSSRPMTRCAMAPLTASPQAYRQSAVLSATPEELVVMLYDGARRFLRQAGAAMADGDVERAHNTLRRAELIIAHLDGTLDDGQGQISERLHAIYRFCLAHLNRGRLGQDGRMLEEVSNLLGELRDSWARVAQGAPARVASPAPAREALSR